MAIRLGNDAKEALVQELRFVASKMGEVQDAASKLYYFTAAYGKIQRVINETPHPEPELVFVQFVLNAAYNAINARAQAMAHGMETPVSIPPNLFDRLQSALGELATAIQSGESTHECLQTIVNLAYSTTGNGYYLFMKGIVRI